MQTIPQTRAELTDAGLTVLNVDDDAAGRYSTSRVLQRGGYHVIEAATGSDALRLAESGPDLIVLDVNLPDMSGFEVSRRLKASEATRHIPILHLSATYVDGESQALGLEAGADGYLTQPIEPAVLLATVRALLRAHRAETELVAASRQWQTTFNAIRDPICLLDADGRIVTGNGALTTLLGRPAVDLVGLSWGEAAGADVDDRPSFADVAQRRERVVEERRFGDRWFQVALDPIMGSDDNVVGAVRTMTDITENRRAAEELRAIDEARAAIFAASPLAIIVFDLVGNVEAWSPAAAAILGWSADEVIGRPYPAVPDGKRDEFVRELDLTMRGEAFTALETSRIRRDGSRVDVSVWAAPLRDARGELSGAIHVLADITERRRVEAERERLVRDLAAYGAENARLLREAEEGRRRAEEASAALAQSEALYRAIGESIAYGVWVCDPDGSLRFLSQSFLDLVGLTLDEYREQGWATCLAPEDVDRVASDWAACVARGADWDYELRVLAADGEYRTILSRGGAVRDSDGRLVGMAGINLDITARKRASQALSFLSDASTLLASSLDHESILANLASLAVPTLGEWCAIDLLTSDGALSRVGVAHVRPEAAEDLRTVATRAGNGRDHEDRRLAVLRTGRPEVIEEIDDARLVQMARDDEHEAILRRIGLRSAMWVPLVARGRTLGVMSLGIGGEGRRYDHQDVELAEEVARRAGLAIDNARLYEAERSARGQAQDAQARLALVARAERARAAELNAVIRAIGDAMVVADANSQVLLVNPAANALVGGRPLTTLADLFSLFVDSGRRPVDPGAILAEADHGEAVELCLPGEPERWLELKTYRVEETPPPAIDSRGGPDDSWPIGDIATSILVLRDVTAARQAHVLREAFIGMLSHELRTPITTIYAGTKVLARPAERVSEDTRREVYKDLEAESERLYRLVEDLLVLSRVEGGAIEIGSEPLLLQHVLAEVVRSEQVRWPSAKFSLTVPPGLPAVMADQTYVEQVARNLLSNAAKYSPEGADIEVVAEVVEDEVQVMVRDEGVGIQPEDLPRLFELFFRSATTAGKVSGAGIGLFVTRQLVEAMGGRIWARPRPAGGAEFGFSLRAMPEEEA